MLFLCTGNSARSILAEAILEREGRGRFKAYSAGSNPKGEVHPLAIDVLTQQGLKTNQFRSKSWNEFANEGAPNFDFIFTVCDNAAGEVCPIWPGQPITAHWGLPDPAAAEGIPEEKWTAFLKTFDRLTELISTFVNLRIGTLASASLQRRLEEINPSKKEMV